MEHQTLPVMEGFPKEIIRKIHLRDQRRKASLPDVLSGQPLQLVLEELLLWDLSVLTVSFKGGDAVVQRQIAEVASEWSKHANIRFDFGYNTDPERFRAWVPGDTSSIRIGFNDPGYWSFLGTDSLDPEICRPGDITLNLNGFDLDLPQNWKSTVLHEFGHALGFHHEHQSPAANCDFDWERLYAYLAGPPNFWSKEQVDYNLKQLPAGGLTYSAHDKNSIMHYSFPAWMFLSGTDSVCYVEENAVLSEEDKIMAGRAYPFDDKLLEEQRLQRSATLTQLLKFAKAFSEPEHHAYQNRIHMLRGHAAKHREYTSIDLQVKNAILIAAGQAGEDPGNLAEQVAIGNLLPTDFAYQFLADLLNDIVKQHNTAAAVRITDVSNANTVADCIQMIIGKV